MSNNLIFGSKTPQILSNNNRNDYNVLYIAKADEDEIREEVHFGSVSLFIEAHAVFLAVIQKWKNVRSNEQIHQITYASQCGRWNIIKPTCFLGLVGVLKEEVDGHGKVLKMIVGALGEVKARGIARS